MGERTMTYIKAGRWKCRKVYNCGAKKRGMYGEFIKTNYRQHDLIWKKENTSHHFAYESN